jgi:hypothetical protein
VSPQQCPQLELVSSRLTQADRDATAAREAAATAQAQLNKHETDLQVCVTGRCNTSTRNDDAGDDADADESP